jgi:hypothetical protein
MPASSRSSSAIEAVIAGGMVAFRRIRKLID